MTTGVALAAAGALYKLTEETSMAKLFRETHPGCVAIPPLDASPESFDRALKSAQAEVELVERLVPTTESEKSDVERLLQERHERVERIRSQLTLARALAKGVAEAARDLEPAQAALVAAQREVNEQARSQAPSGWSDQFSRDVQARIGPIEIRCRRAEEAMALVNAAIPLDLRRAADRAGATARKLSFEADESERNARVFENSPRTPMLEDQNAGFASEQAAVMAWELQARRLRKEAQASRYAANRAVQEEVSARKKVEEARQRLLSGKAP